MIEKKVKSIVAGSLLVGLVVGLVANALFTQESAAQTSSSPTGEKGRYQMVTATALERNLANPPMMGGRSSPDYPEYPRQYDKIYVIDTATGATWFLDDQNGYVSVGVAPGSRLGRKYKEDN